MNTLTQRIRRDVAYVARRTRDVIRAERRFERFLWRAGSMPRRDGIPAVVVVQPWWGTGEPWCMLATALLLHKQYGNTVVLWDDSVVNRGDVGTHFEQLAIRRALSKLPITWYRLSDFSGACPLGYSEIERAARGDAIKGFRGEEWSPLQVAHARRLMSPMRKVAGQIDAFLRTHPARYLLVSTGYQSSGALYPPIGRLRGVRVATTDGNAGSRLVAVDGVAAHLPEVAQTWEMIKPLEDWAIDLARRECEKRASGRDRYSYQPVASDEAGADDVAGALLPLNQSYDTSAMGRSQFFTGQRDWMLQTVAWLLENTDAVVTVRQHPVERMYPGNDDYGETLRLRFGQTPRVRFHDCNARVNTYDLVRRAKVVLPHTSSVGMEAIAVGKPVVVEARSFYAEMGVVEPAPSRESYFERIRDALSGSVIVADEQRRRAWACWYLSQYACYVPTVFTGYSVDFDNWVQQSVDWLLAREDVQLVLEAIDSGTPATYLRHLSLRKQASAS